MRLSPVDSLTNGHFIDFKIMKNIANEAKWKMIMWGWIRPDIDTENAIWTYEFLNYMNWVMNMKYIVKCEYVNDVY